RSWDESFTLHGHEASVSVVASDTFAKIARFTNYARTPVGAGELTGTRIDRILDEVGYLGDRFIDAGEHTLQATDLAGNAVTLLKDTAEAEGGAVWCGPDGAI